MPNLIDYGFRPSMMPENADGIPARVTAVHRDRYTLYCEHGEISGRLKAGVYYGDGREEFPTVGDFVLTRANPGGDSQIFATLPRRTFFSRRDPTPGRREQAVAANFDYVFILQALGPDFNLKRLERYLTLAWQSGGVPVVVLTKADLSEDAGGYVRAAQKTAEGVDVFAVSVKTGEGMDALSPYRRPGKTIVLLGSSGVGKSSLANALAGEPVMAVREIREDDGKGRHTTTHRQLMMLPGGVMLIDTPGMRELGIGEAGDGLPEAFADVEAVLGGCRFRDCRHQGEPGCAVKAAIAGGRLTQGTVGKLYGSEGRSLLCRRQGGVSPAKTAEVQGHRAAKQGAAAGGLPSIALRRAVYLPGMRGPGRAGGGRERAPQPLSELPVQPPCG